MTRNRFNQAEHQSKSSSTSRNHLTLSKAHGLFLEDNGNIDMEDTYKITNVHPPRDQKDVVNKEFCDNNLLSSNNNLNILSKNITELRKVEFEEVTTGQLNANIIGLPSSTTNGDTVWIDGDTVELVSLNSSNISTLANKFTEIETNIFHFGNKVSADIISKYNELKVEFHSNRFNQSNTNIQLGDEFEKSPLHTIIYGATGTGRTFFVRQYLKLFLNGNSSVKSNQDQDQKQVDKKI